MSRCFPYTPLRREEPLIESIKKGKDKDKKKDKEERRKDKKENKEYNNNDPTNDQHKKHRHKKRKHKEISLLQHKDNCSTRAVNHSFHLEKSGLTEEHGMPIQNPESSEGSHDSSARRKIATTVNNSTNGNIFRIKLSVLRQVNQDVPLLPRVELQQKSGPSVGILKHEMQERCTISDQACFSGRTVDTNPEKEKRRSSQYSRPEGKKYSRDLKKFNKLVENWDVPKLQLESRESGYQDWLFATRNQPSEPCASKLIRAEDGSSHLSSSASSNFAPRAYYVSELDMYQLPYVIPF